MFLPDPASAYQVALFQQALYTDVKTPIEHIHTTMDREEETPFTPSGERRAVVVGSHPMLRRRLESSDYLEVRWIDVADACALTPSDWADAASQSHAVLYESGEHVISHLHALVAAATAATVPLIALSEGPVLHEIQALTMGADYVVGPPFNDLRLLTYLAAFDRRRQTIVDAHAPRERTGSDQSSPAPSARPPQESKPALEVASKVELTPGSRNALFGSVWVTLSPKGRDVIMALAAEVGCTVSRDYLLNEAWGINCMPSSTVVTTAISKLRRTLKRAGIKNPITTVRGEGYRLEVETVVWNEEPAGAKYLGMD